MGNSASNMAKHQNNNQYFFFVEAFSKCKGYTAVRSS